VYRMSQSLTPEQRQLRASMAAYSRWAQQDPREGTAAPRAASWARFENQVDPDRTLSEGERYRRAKAAQNAHMKRMALASSRARSKDGPK
jgi:hypothetical protein